MILKYIAALVAHEEKVNSATLIKNGDKLGCFHVRAKVGDAFQCVQISETGCCKFAVDRPAETPVVDANLIGRSTTAVVHAIQPPVEPAPAAPKEAEAAPPPAAPAAADPPPAEPAPSTISSGPTPPRRKRH